LIVRRFLKVFFGQVAGATRIILAIQGLVWFFALWRKGFFTHSK
jgi:hypothetical protein